MTIEFSLRRRATQARCFATIWLGLAVTILICAYISFPFIANRTLDIVVQLAGQNLSANKDSFIGTHMWMLAIAIIGLELALVMFACFLLSRTAYVEIELAARFVGLADALCVAGDNFEDFEKAADVLVPKPKYLSVPEIVSISDLKSLADLVKPSR